MTAEAYDHGCAFWGRRLLLVLAVCCLAATAGCGGRPDPGPEVGDASVRDGERVEDAPRILPDRLFGDAVPPFDSAPTDGVLPFCSGDTPRMVANGVESTPGVTGLVVPLDCCDAAEFRAVTATAPQGLVPIVVFWRAPPGQSALPAVLDLANLPQGWTVRVYVGCDPAQGTCDPAPDRYDEGFSGSLGITPINSGGYLMTLCLSVAERPESPHPLLHSLQLFAPDVQAVW